MNPKNEHIVCPHCGFIPDDSADWGCPDMEWTEVTGCPQCEGEFEWSRTITVEYECTKTQ